MIEGNKIHGTFPQLRTLMTIGELLKLGREENYLLLGEKHLLKTYFRF